MFRLLNAALKGYLVLRVFLLVRKGQMIDAIKLIRKWGGHMSVPYKYHAGGGPGLDDKLYYIRNARDFAADVREHKWPETTATI